MTLKPSIKSGAPALILASAVWLCVSKASTHAEDDRRFAPKEAADAIDSRIAGKSKSTDWLVYTDNLHGFRENEIFWKRNSNCWAADLDLTGVSPFNDPKPYEHGFGVAEAVTVISPWHVIGTTHSFPAVGEYLVLVDNDSNVITPKPVIIASARLKASGNAYPDISIALLDSPLPDSITPVKVLPDDWKSYLGNPRGLPVLGFDIHEHAIVTEIHVFDFEHEPGVFRNFMQAPTNRQRLEFYKEVEANDSANPAFLILDNQPVLITLWSSGGPGAGNSLVRLKREINQVMGDLFDTHNPDQAGSSPALREFDMSSIYTPIR
ncbi:MAG: hypothetical protein AAGA96_01460 [Verrucomicrobiota bacterium]